MTQLSVGNSVGDSSLEIRTGNFVKSVTLWAHLQSKTADADLEAAVTSFRQFSKTAETDAETAVTNFRQFSKAADADLKTAVTNLRQFYKTADADPETAVTNFTRFSKTAAVDLETAGGQEAARLPWRWTGRRRS